MYTMSPHVQVPKRNGEDEDTYDSGYMNRKIRKFRTEKIDTWNKRKFWLMQPM